MIVVFVLFLSTFFAITALDHVNEAADDALRHQAKWPSATMRSASTVLQRPACWPDCRIYDGGASQYNRTTIKLRQAALLRTSAHYTFPNGARAWRTVDLPQTALAKLASYHSANQIAHGPLSREEQLALLRNASTQVHRLLPGIIPFGHEQAALDEAFDAGMPSIEDMSGGAMESKFTQASLLECRKPKPTLLEMFRRLSVLFSTEGSMREDPLNPDFEVLLRTVPIHQGTTNDLEHLEHVDSSPHKLQLQMAR